MFCWDINKVKAVFERTGFDLELHDAPGCAEPWESYLFVGRKRSDANRGPTATHDSAGD